MVGIPIEFEGMPFSSRPIMPAQWVVIYPKIHSLPTIISNPVRPYRQAPRRWEMARSRYSFQKRQKELERKRKKELKRQNRINKKSSAIEENAPPPQGEEENS